MPILQNILRNMFGYAAIICGGMFAAMMPVLVRAPFPHATDHFHAEPVGLLLILMRELLVLLPPIVAVVNGVAWLMLRKGSRTARPWAIAASISIFTLSAPFLVADIVIQQYHLTGLYGFAGVLTAFFVLSLLGISGVAAFAKRDAMSMLIPSRVPAEFRKAA